MNSLLNKYTLAGSKLHDNVANLGGTEQKLILGVAILLRKITFQYEIWVSHFLDCVNSNPGQGIFPNHREDSSSHPLQASDADVKPWQYIPHQSFPS